MERTLTTTRIYALGSYQNIQLTNTLSNIPNELALDPEFLKNIEKLQLIEIEQAYYNYAKLREDTSGAKSISEILNLLEEERTTEVQELFNNTKLKDYIEKLMVENERS